MGGACERLVQVTMTIRVRVLHNQSICFFVGAKENQRLAKGGDQPKPFAVLEKKRRIKNKQRWPSTPLPSFIALPQTKAADALLETKGCC